MKRMALMAILSLCLGDMAHAAMIDLTPVHSSAPIQIRVDDRLPAFAATSRNQIVAPPRHASELPEPEVFAMMLVGLVLIGYRASRDRSEQFK